VLRAFVPAPPPPIYAVPPPPPPEVLVTNVPERIIYVPGTQIPPGWTEKGVYAMPPGANIAVPEGYYITNDGRLAQSVSSVANAPPFHPEPTYVPEPEIEMYKELPGIATSMQYRELLRQKQSIESEMDNLAREIEQKMKLETHRIGAGISNVSDFDRAYGISGSKEAPLDALLQRKK
jgi:hypothetical protein